MESEGRDKVSTSSTTCFDAPKSASLMHPLLSTRIFAPWNKENNGLRKKDPFLHVYQ